MSNRTAYNCIIITEPQPVTGNTALKYRNVTNLDKFKIFAEKFPGRKYINVYLKETKQYYGRIYFE